MGSLPIQFFYQNPSWRPNMTREKLDRFFETLTVKSRCQNKSCETCAHANCNCAFEQYQMTLEIWHDFLTYYLTDDKFIISIIKVLRSMKNAYQKQQDLQIQRISDFCNDTLHFLQTRNLYPEYEKRNGKKAWCLRYGFDMDFDGELKKFYESLT